MKIRIALLVATIASSGFSAEKDHSVYIEPDFSWNIPYQFNYEAENTHIKQSAEYYGINLGYELLKPNNLYANLETSLSMGNRMRRWSSESQGKANIQDFPSKNKIEGKLGYTFQSGSILWTLFTGTGGFFLGNPGEQFNIAYVPTGFKIAYQTPHFSIGIKSSRINFVHVWTDMGGEKSDKNVLREGYSGYELSIPVSFEIKSPNTEWYSIIEPYYLQITPDLSFIGGRVSANHDF